MWIVFATLVLLCWGSLFHMPPQHPPQQVFLTFFSPSSPSASCFRNYVIKGVQRKISLLSFFVIVVTSVSVWICRCNRCVCALPAFGILGRDHKRNWALRKEISRTFYQNKKKTPQNTVNVKKERKEKCMCDVWWWASENGPVVAVVAATIYRKTNVESFLWKSETRPHSPLHVS